MSQFSHLSNEELRQELIKYGIPCGPIGLTTRKVYEKRLEKKMANNSASFTRHDFDKVYEKRLEKKMANDSASFTRHDFDEDDHTESSRIISPQNRYKGRYSSNLNEKRFSPFDEFKNMGSSAWGFFSRSTGTSTPCSDFNYLNKSSTNKYRRSIYSDEGSKQHLSDYSFRIFLVFIAFVIGIFATYLYKMHSSTVYSTVMAGKDLIFNVFNYAFYPLIGLFVVFIVCFGIYKLFNYIKFRNIEHKQTLVKLVDRITDIIYESGFSGVAEPHVRDMLMPPTKRSNEDYKLWLEAAHFINNEDSRVRTEIRLINGTECNVWIWSGAGKQRWQGAAVAETSPSSHPIPSVALSCSLKLRGLNFSNNKIECNGLKNEILAKLPVVPKYIDFSNTNNECIVYIMLKDLNDAKKAFLALHSQWFDGNLITVKYIKDERYAERFPGHT